MASKPHAKKEKATPATSPKRRPKRCFFLSKGISIIFASYTLGNQKNKLHNNYIVFFGSIR
jgi:hypothetical protein